MFVYAGLCSNHACWYILPCVQVMRIGVCRPVCKSYMLVYAGLCSSHACWYMAAYKVRFMRLRQEYLMYKLSLGLHREICHKTVRSWDELFTHHILI